MIYFYVMKNQILFTCLAVLLGLFSGCDHEDEKPKSKKLAKKQLDFFEINYQTKRYNYGDTLRFDLKNLSKSKMLDSVVLQCLDQKLAVLRPGVNKVPSVKMKLGTEVYSFRAYFSDKSYQVKQRSIDIYPIDKPKPINYKVLAKYPHDVKSYTQGLQFINGELYESTGQVGKSIIRKNDLKTGEALKMNYLKQDHFGEGMTVVGDEVYQLTWKARTGYIFDQVSLKLKSNFLFPDAIDGWGLTWTGDHFVVSDGSNKLWSWNKELRRIDFVTVADNTQGYTSLNELEYIDGVIYANVYQTYTILKIDAQTGQVLGKVDLENLLTPLEKSQLKQFDEVLNGIAYNKVEDVFYLTGKHWPFLYEVKFDH